MNQYQSWNCPFKNRSQPLPNRSFRCIQHNSTDWILILFKSLVGRLYRYELDSPTTLTSYKTKNPQFTLRVFRRSATTYSPGFWPVPSALVSLTSLFGMGRGGPNRNNHLKKIEILIEFILFISFRVISNTWLWHCCLYICVLSTSSSLTTLNEYSSWGEFRA